MKWLGTPDSAVLFLRPATLMKRSHVRKSILASGKLIRFNFSQNIMLGLWICTGFVWRRMGAQGGLVWTRWWTLANINAGSFLALLSDSERKKTKGQIAQILKQQKSHSLPPYGKGWPVLQVGKSSPASYATQCPCSQESATGPSPTGQRQTYVFA